MRQKSFISWYIVYPYNQQAVCKVESYQYMMTHKAMTSFLNLFGVSVTLLYQTIQSLASGIYRNLNTYNIANHFWIWVFKFETQGLGVTVRGSGFRI